MQTHLCARPRALVLFLALLGGMPALAVDGVIEINQARALAGGVTSGDAPGLPVTLSRSGSYRLTGNIATGSQAITAVQVEADEVTLDLNGFTIACFFPSGPLGAAPLACSTGGSGRGVSGVGESATVRNGHIRGMGSVGVLLGTGARVEDLTVVRNEEGINVGPASTVTGNSARENRVSGIAAQNGSVVRGNESRENGGPGITVFGAGSLVVGNTSVRNGGFGLSLFRVTLGDGTVLMSGYKDNVIQQNAAGTVQGGIQIGTNVCDDNTTCP